MNDQEFRKHVELIMSMSTDFLVNKLSKETYNANLAMIAKKIDPQQEDLVLKSRIVKVIKEDIERNGIISQILKRKD